METTNSIEADLWALLLCALALGIGLIAMLAFGIKEKRRASRERRRYREEVREERRKEERSQHRPR